MMNDTKDNRPLGDFLRAKRQRLDPAALGITTARRRRTPGLRREEVAERAGISSEWYVKLEQGRDVAPSTETIGALARALSLDATETAHLRRLATRQATAFIRETVPEIVAAIVERLPDPAYVTGSRWDVLGWNAAADAVFGFSNMEPAERNILLFMFSASAAASLFGTDWPPQAKRMLALFRVNYDAHAGDPAFEELVAALTERSTDFSTWWKSHDVCEPAAGSKTLHIDNGGTSSYVHATFQSNDDPRLRLALYQRRNIME
jgi:transcriptional regulator with XRE-family HTH domain